MTYTCNEQIHVGDGTGLKIHHIWSSFQSQVNLETLSVNQLLHVPSITKNLLSISKFAVDNGVFFEFFSKHCYVKDKVLATF